jgi:polyhydroxybutyrate depolymerase
VRAVRRLIVPLVLAGLLAACSSSGRSASPENTATTVPTVTTTIPRCTVKSQPELERIDLNVGGKARYALVHVPVHWNGKSALPVVLSFHGLGSNADQQRTLDRFVAHSDKDNFIVVYPQASGSLADLGAAWDLKGTSEVTFVKALLANLARRECVNPARVYATGLSYGGAVTDLMACDLSDEIAAAAPVSAYLPERPCTPARPIPIMSFHGVEDHLLPYKGGGPSLQRPFEQWGADWAKRYDCAPTPATTQYKPTVEQIKYSGCKAPLVLYRVHHNGHTWPGHPLGIDHQVLVNYFSGKTTGKPFALMVYLHLTPEEFADTISLANTQIDASSMILRFFGLEKPASTGGS